MLNTLFICLLLAILLTRQSSSTDLKKECHRIKKILPLYSIAIEGHKFVKGDIVTADSSIFILKNNTKLWSESVSRRTAFSCVLRGHVPDKLRQVCMTMKGRATHKGSHMSSEEQELQRGQLKPTTIILEFCSKKNLPPLITFSGKSGCVNTKQTTFVWR